MKRDFGLHTGRGALPGQLSLPQRTPGGLILVGQLHATPVDIAVTASLSGRNYAILSVSLLTLQEMHFPDAVYNVPLLSQRLTDILDLASRDSDTGNLPVGLFVSGHVTPAAIRAAACRDRQVQALACHGGLIDQAGLQYLRLLAAPLLMLADAEDPGSAVSFQRAASHLSVTHQLHRLGPGENPSGRVAGWFGEHLQAV